MSMIRLKTIGDINRLRRILAVIFRAGGGAWIERTRQKRLVPWSCRIKHFFHPVPLHRCLVQVKRGSQTVSSETLRNVLEKLGPTFIKLGQVLSLRADLVGENISRELSGLQSDVAPFPYEEARKIIGEELKQASGPILESMEKTPVAAASLAQVYKAFLKDGTMVAVKVQRPDIKVTIEQDVHILFYLAHLAERFIPELRPYQPYRVVERFADWTLRELDFKVEGNNAERFRFAFKGNPHIKIPLVYWEHTSSRVLTMEFVQGVKADDLDGIKRLAIDPRQLALHGVGALFQEFLIDGFFHADPHPGNFFALPGDVLCFHDFGMVGYLTREQRKELVSCLVAFADKDIDAFFRHFMHMAIISEESDVSGFRNDLAAVLSELFFSPHQTSVAKAFFHAINNGARKRIWFPADLALFGKAIITTEAMGLKLFPEFDLNEEMKPLVEKSLRAYLSPERMLKALRTGIFDYVDLLASLAERTQRILERIDKGELSVRLDTAELLGIKKEFDRQNDLRLIGMVTTAVFVVFVILLFLEGRKAIGGLAISKIIFFVLVGLLAWFLAKIIRKPK